MTVKAGDVVLKLGHPIGYRLGRAPVVRAGRVLYAQDDVFVSDCLLADGDSGGPFFDLDGRLVGIVRFGVFRGKLAESLANATRVRRPSPAPPTHPFASGSPRCAGELAEMDRNVVGRFMERISKLNRFRKKDKPRAPASGSVWCGGQARPVERCGRPGR